MGPLVRLSRTAVDASSPSVASPVLSLGALTGRSARDAQSQGVPSGAACWAGPSIAAWNGWLADTRERPTTERVGSVAVPTAVPLVDQLTALQQSAGNRAVSTMLSRSGGAVATPEDEFHAHVKAGGRHLAAMRCHRSRWPRPCPSG